jgi:hypothetical protein
MLKRASRAFAKAQRVAGDQLSGQCRDDFDARLQELSALAAALAAAS